MSETKFTPGPWLIRMEGTMTGRGPEIYVDGPYYDDGSEFVVADCGSSECRETGAGRWKRTADGAVKNANSHLIAASPEMYEVLATALLWEMDYRLRNNLGKQGPDWVERGLAALKKARGER